MIRRSSVVYFVRNSSVTNLCKDLFLYFVYWCSMFFTVTIMGTMNQSFVL